MTKLFIDLDGVMADMNSAYAAIAGTPPDKTLDNLDWRLVVATPGFYANMPPLPDMEELWAYVSTWPDVTILTGYPRASPRPRPTSGRGSPSISARTYR